MPAENLCQRISGGSRQDRHRQRARSNDPEGEEETGKLPGQRLESGSGLIRRADVGNSMFAEGEGRGHQDREHDCYRCCHSEDDIDPHPKHPAVCDETVVDLEFSGFLDLL